MRGTGRDRIRKDTGQWIRSARSQEAQGQYSRTGIHRPRKARVPESSIESSIPRTRRRFGSYGSQTRRQDCYGGNTYQGYPGGGNKQRNHPIKDDLLKSGQKNYSGSGPFGAVSGGSDRCEITWGTGSRQRASEPPGTLAGTQAQNQIAQAAPANAQASANQGATAVSAVTDVSGIVENAMPSIVAINDTMTVEQPISSECPRPIQPQSSGSGIIVNQTDTELLIATNNHVVDGASDLKVTFVDNKDVSAAVKGTVQHLTWQSSQCS